MTDRILTARHLNRALLHRQMLLRREAVTPQEAIHRLFVLQAQLPRAPFIGLWNRIEGFRRDDLLAALRARKIVRSTLMRGTLHLATAEDILAFRNTVTASRDVALPGGARPSPEVIDRALALAAEHFAAEPKDFDSIRAVYEREGLEPVRPLAWAARVMLPLVQADAPEAPWGHTPGGEFVMAHAWLGREPTTEPQAAALLRRYIAAHGPVTPAMLAAWSGLQGAAAVFAELGDELVTHKDERGRTLHDLKGMTLPDPDTPAPPRLLPDFDAAVLIKENRARIVPPEFEPHLTSRNLMVPPMLLVDGFVAGRWQVTTKRKITTIAVTVFKTITAKDRKAVEAEGETLARFLEPETAAAVTFDAV